MAKGWDQAAYRNVHDADSERSPGDDPPTASTLVALTDQPTSGTLLAMHRSAHRIVAALILAFWLVPGASALVVGLHVAIDHHAHGDEETQLALLSLTRAAVHGHHHDSEAALGHDHDGISAQRAPAPKSNPSLANALPSKDSLESWVGQSSIPGPAPQCRAPAPPFAAYSSLLL